ncbi:MAG TPA: hypothetical protein VGI40_12430 [Pirellulaceae bacterium]|jgi:aspartokinase-like uncharacterized kinase
MPGIRVVKVGGSLFDWPLLPLALDAWLNEQPSATNVLIAGGGNLVESIRQASQVFSLDDETAHWLCIEAMSIQARLLGSLLVDVSLVASYGALQTATQAGSCNRIVFDAIKFLREQEFRLPGHALPHDWSVTSDSIAARLAEVFAADELVLLKSADSPSETTAVLVNAGFVDRHFPSFDRCCFRRRFVNLRQVAKCPAEVEI